MSAEHSDPPQTTTDLAAAAGAEGSTPCGTQSTVPPIGEPGLPPEPLPTLHYRALEFHAKGNLGEVLRAQDRVVGREVALKRMQEHCADHPDSRRRFLREAEVTGRLEHPGVVPVYGIEQDDNGRPCYAMRFIQGETLKDAIDRFHKSFPAPPGERRLALRQLLNNFVSVCKTMAYAHSRGVIHRDLKPANIMLGKYGETLVVDWGLAKAVERDDVTGADDEATLRPTLDGGAVATQQGLVAGTPAYCSPEQAAGQWDVVGPPSDIFSLGAVLYNLLTGRVPYNGSVVLEILAQACMGDVIPPRQRKGDVPRALEAVCLKAMARDRPDRYRTALDLAEDVEHWLADEPVSAYREGGVVRLGRWTRRHRVLVAATMALLLTAVVGLTFGLVAVNRERQNTEVARASEARRRKEARKALDAMSARVIDDLLSKQKQLLPEHKAFLEEALRSYEDFARDTGQDEESRAGVAAASRRVGDIYYRLGQDAEGEAAYRRGVELYRQLTVDFPDQPDYRFDLAVGHTNLGNLLRDSGRPRDAESADKDGLALLQQLADEFPDRPEYRAELSRIHHNLGVLLADAGRSEEAQAAYGKAIALDKRLAADFPDRPYYRSELALCHHNLGLLLGSAGRFQEAEAAYKAALALQKQLAAEFPDQPGYRFDQARSHNSRGLLLEGAGRSEEAEAAYREALTLQKRLAADFPTRPEYRAELALSHTNLGNLLDDDGRTREAEAAYREALALQKQVAAEFPDRPYYRSQLAVSYSNLGDRLDDDGRTREAEAAYREALALQKQVVAELPERPGYRADLARSHTNLGQLLADAGRPREAEAAYREALALQKRLAVDFPTEPGYRAELATSHAKLGDLLKDTGRPKEAEAAYQDALTLQKRLAADFPTRPDYQADLAETLGGLAGLVNDRKDHAEACRLLEEAHLHIRAALAINPRRPSFRAVAAHNRQTWAWARLGLGEHATAAVAAEELLPLGKDPATAAYDAACVLTQCVPLAGTDAKLSEEKRQEQAGKYADRAMALLRQAVTAGYKDTENMKKDKHLDPLRGRDDFKKLVSDLQAKSVKPGK